MAIDIGDAVLTFLGDTTQLDQTFNKVGTETAGKLAPASAAVQSLGEDTAAFNAELDATGQNVAYAGSLIQESMTLSRQQVREAKGEAGLLGEAFGIHLPRHVRSFIAEIPAIGTILSAAFSATAVFFLIEALAQAIAKIQEWSEHAEKVAAAWQKYDQTIFESSTHMQAEIDKQQQKLIEMTQGPVAGLDFALKHLQTTAFQTFDLISKQVVDAVAAMHESSSSLLGVNFNVFGPAADDLKKFQGEMQKTMREAAKASPTDPFAPYNAGISAVQEKERELTKLIAQRTAASGKDASAAVDGLHAERQAINDMLPLLQKGVELQQKKDAGVKQSDVGARANEQVAEAKRVEAQELASIESVKAKAHAAFTNRELDADGWSKAEIKAAFDARKAHEDYLAKVEGIYKKAGDAIKAHATAEELATQTTKNAAKANDDLAKAMEGLDKENKKFDETTKKTFADMSKVLATVEVKSPFSPMVKSALELNQALKALGTQGFGPMEQHLQIALKAEKALNDAGIHGGKVWLQVQAAKLKAIIAIEQATGKSAKAEIQALQKVEAELKKFDTGSKRVQKTLKDMREEMVKDAQVFMIDLGAAMGAALVNHESVAQAMLATTLKLISQMAAQWAEYYAILAIADIWTNPAKAAAEVAAAVALGALSGALGAVASNMSGKSSGGSSGDSGASIDKSNPATQPAQQPVQVINAQHFAKGGLVDTPRMALVGDVREAIVPLDRDSRALHEIADIVAEHIGAGGTVNNYHVNGLISADTLQRFSRRMNRDVRSSRIRVRSSDSYRVTKRG